MSSSKTIISSLFASHVYSLYSVQIDSKPSVNTQTHKFLDLAQVMMKLIFRTEKIYVECQETDFITFSESRYQALSQNGCMSSA